LFHIANVYKLIVNEPTANPGYAGFIYHHALLFTMLAMTTGVAHHAKYRAYFRRECQTKIKALCLYTNNAVEHNAINQKVSEAAGKFLKEEMASTVKSLEENKSFETAWLSANLVQTYGKKALIAMRGGELVLQQLHILRRLQGFRACGPAKHRGGLRGLQPV
jgi:hypothetical protein